MKTINIITIFIFSLILSHTSHASVFPSDSLALVALYDSTGGDSWTNNTGWKSDTMGAWYGITLADGHVISISLVNNNLVGCIPPEIGNLDSLEVLEIFSNSGLTDSIPHEIGNLSKLRRLYAGNCNLIGSIPWEIGQLSNLTDLWLGENALEDAIPSSIGNLTKLGYLGLYQNNLTGSLPSELGNLVNATSFELDWNHFTGSIPSSLGNLTNLRTLRLQYNNLSGSIPPQIGNMSMLQRLFINGNQLTGGIPPELGNMTELLVLSIGFNPLGDSIPPELGNMTNLMSLELGSAQLVGPIPEELTKLSNLLNWNLASNNLTGSLPANIGKMTKLQTINFETNQLSGEIPDSIGNLFDVYEIDMGNNKLSGSIPPELGNLTNLANLGLYNNELTGTIPPEIGNCSNLWSFMVNDNQLSGTIPWEIGKLTNLRDFIVVNNKLSGAIPDSMLNCVNLFTLFLSHNQFDNLPDFSNYPIGNFYVEDNKFSFGDLEPNIHILNAYSPQDSIEVADTIYFTIDDTLTLLTQTDGLYNNYQWTLNGVDITDNTLYSGANDSVLLIMAPNLSDAGAYSCEVTNDTVTGLTLYRHPIILYPGVKITDLPEVTQCANDSINIGYKSAEVLPGNIFSVELSNSSGSFTSPVIIGNKTSTDSKGTIRAHIPDSISSGDIYRVRVNASNPALTGVASINSLAIMNGNLSNPVILPSSDSSICEGSSLSLITDVIPGAYYLWYLDDVAISVAIFSEYSTDAGGSYYVKIYNECSSDSFLSNAVNVTVDALPIITLTMAGLVLTATQDANYVYIWHKDGDILPLAATQYQYTATENGEYWVEVTDKNGCSEVSNHQTVSITIVSDAPNRTVDVIPNPTNGIINIKTNEITDIKRVIITNSVGEMIIDEQYDLSGKTNMLEYDLSQYSAGVYLVIIQTTNDSNQIKIIKK
ncbi:MAG: T9SS type A sorting domain-containing protein [Bacteroidales bacterium]|nr:T9SS type A sorting domain-containing protein [Bacteroidales bacterium]